MSTQNRIKTNLSQTLIFNLPTQGLAKITDPKVTNKFIKLAQFAFSTHLYAHELLRSVWLAFTHLLASGFFGRKLPFQWPQILHVPLHYSARTGTFQVLKTVTLGKSSVPTISRKILRTSLKTTMYFQPWLIDKEKTMIPCRHTKIFYMTDNENLMGGLRD